MLSIFIFLLLALFAVVAACSLDFIEVIDLSAYPIVSNVIAGVFLLPLEILIVTVLVTNMLAYRERKRWITVTDALTEAVTAKWTEYRDLIWVRYRGCHAHDAEAKIEKALQIWGPMHDREVEADDLGWDLETKDYCFPDDGEAVLTAVNGIWMQMWGAGADERENALSRRLTATLLPRLLPNKPTVTAAVRVLNDAIEDLNDQRADLSSREDPFPISPYIDKPESSHQQRIPYGMAIAACDALESLQDLLKQVDRIVETGDHLVALLPETERTKELRRRAQVRR